MICPKCGSGRCRRSHRRGTLDYALTLLDLRPWRCHTCEWRFYGWSVAFSHSPYAHCPNCGNFDLRPIARERVERGTLLWVKRRLIFPAYRCEPCRERFFSIRPLRRILAESPPAASDEVSSNVPND